MDDDRRQMEEDKDYRIKNLINRQAESAMSKLQARMDDEENKINKYNEDKEDVFLSTERERNERLKKEQEQINEILEK
jgi:hypothetical protein